MLQFVAGWQYVPFMLSSCKEKKDAAKAKELAKEEKAKEQADDKAKKSLVSMCDTAVTKLAPAKAGLDMVMSQPLVVQPPALISDALKNAYSKVKAIFDEAPLATCSYTLRLS